LNILLKLCYFTPIWSSKLVETNVAIASHVPTFGKFLLLIFGSYSKSFAVPHVPSKVRENWSSNCKIYVGETDAQRV